MGLLFRAACAALAGAVCGCSAVELDVLEPGASRDASLDASIGDAPADVQLDSPFVDGGGGEAGAPDASVVADADAGGEIGCEAVGVACSVAGECCTLACVGRGAGSDGRSCGEGPECQPASGACQSGADCCSNLCMGGKCAPPPPPCKPAGETCGGNGECCGQTCTAGRCALLEACRVQGEICVSSGDCCSGQCVLDTQSVGHCAALPMCMANDHQGCTRQVGEICGGDADCCSRDCEMVAGSVHRCAPAGGCSGQCERCDADADCCSGYCAGAGEGPGICQPTACGADGEFCGGSGDCCAGSTCVNEPMPAGARRCEAPGGDAACRSDGAGCSSPEECCGGHCLPASSGGFTCASACVADGGACTSDADCCGTGLACMVVYGALRCVPLAP